MRRLRIFLSAGCLARGAGATAPAGAVIGSGGVSRRVLLGGIVAAPVAVPAVVRAAASPTTMRGASLLAAGLDVQRDCTVGLASFKAPEISSIAGALQPVDLSELTSADVVGARNPEAVLAQISRERSRFEALSLSHAPICTPFIDDVGSGP